MHRNPLEAGEYARLTGFDGKWRETWWRRDFLELFFRRHGLDSARSLLDVGCGAGHWGRTLSRVLPADLVAGVDIEKAFVDKAEELGAAFGLPRRDYRVGDAETLPYEEASFDLVTCQTVLIHVKDPARALREMRRVLKPGGALVVAEPNNLAGYFNSLLAEPRPEWTVVQRLVDFYHTCLQGKRELGHGDSAIAERLPRLIAQAGFQAVSVGVNENCPALIPPYESEAQAIEVEFLKSFLGKEIWAGFGPRANSLRFFLAGGGSEAAFAEAWDLAMTTQKRMLAALEQGRYHGGRAWPMYLIAARK